MKKFYTMILAAFAAVATVCANPVARVSGDSHDADPMMNDSIVNNDFTNPLPLPSNPRNNRHFAKRAEIDSKVTFLDIQVEDGVAYFYWTGDGDAEVYFIQLYVVNDATEEGYEVIAEGAWYADAFDLDGFNGFSTSLLLEYGYTAVNYPQYYSEETYAKYVTDEFALKAGKYILLVEGTDEDLNTVEKYAAAGFEVEDTTTKLLDIKQTNMNTKVLIDGRLYIQTNNGVFDVIGNKIK